MLGSKIQVLIIKISDRHAWGDQMNKTIIRFISVAANLYAGLIFVISAQAAFQVIENFDSLTLGDINGQNGWFATRNSNSVVLDPVDGDNQVLKVITESGILHKALSIAQGTTRMVFMRFRFEEHCEFSFGLSHLSNPSEHSHFGPEMGMAPATAYNPANEFRAANGFLPNETYDVLTTLLPGTWYNIWVLVDNTKNIYQIWMHSIPGGGAQPADQLVNSSGDSLFRFRTATGQDLRSFFIKTGCGGSPFDGRFYLDDIYLDDAHDINLDNPLGPGAYLPWLKLLLLDDEPS